MPSRNRNPRNTLGPVDLDRPLIDHTLNVGRVLWLYGASGVPTGGGRWPDLCVANNGTLASRPTWAPTGRGDSGLSFSGSNYVSLPLVSTQANNFGFAAWIKPDFSQHNIGVTFNGNTGGNGWGFWLLSGNINVVSDGNSFSSVSPSGTLPVGVWTHAVFTRVSGSNSLYMNGVLVGTGTQAFNTPTAGGGAVGGRAGGANLFAGSVSDYSVWDRGLSAADAASLYGLSRREYHGVLRRWSPSSWFVGTSPPPPSGAFVPLLSGVGW